MNSKHRLPVLLVFFLSLLSPLARAGWVTAADLISPLHANGNRFGVDLQLEGTTLIAGSSGTDYGMNGAVGSVVSFERNASGAWLSTQHLTYPAESSNSGIGRRLALEGNTLLISVITATAGRVLVYERNAPGAQWQLVQTLTGDAQNEYFGNSVAMDGTTAVIGADNSLGTTGTARKGAVYVFTRIGSGNWARVTKILAPEEATDTANFGSFVALSGDWLAVNARSDGPYRGGIRGTSGATYLYRRSGVWSLHRKLVPDPEVAQETGWEHTELKDGVLVIGAPRGTNPVSPFTYGGAAYIYTLDPGGNNWSSTPQKLPVTPPPDVANYGTDISIEGSRMMIGASSEQSTGKVYTYTRGTNGVWTEDGGFTRAGLTGTPFFGERVVLNEGRLAVAAGNLFGAPGRVFIYQEGVALQAVTGGSFAVGATQASMLGTVLSEATATPVFFDYGLTTNYEFTLPASQGSVQTTGTPAQVNLSIGALVPQTTYHYRVRAGTSTGADATFTTAAYSGTLADAVDAPQLDWDSSGTYGSWQRQTVGSFDGSDVARSPAGVDNSNPRLMTTVTGPGELSFRWKVSSELNKDFLGLIVNGSIQTARSGEQAWEQLSYSIPPGRYEFVWIYQKDASGFSGEDAAWVDTVVWTPTPGTAAWNAWRSAKFNSTQLNDGNTSGPTADPESDGLPNLAEAFFNTLPLGTTPARLSPAHHGDALHVTWLEPLTANGVRAVPEWSPNGITWLTSGQSAVGIPARDISVALVGATGAGYTLTARLAAAGTPRALLRLRFEIIP